MGQGREGGGEGKGGYPILYTAGMDTTDQKYTADCGPGWEIDNTSLVIILQGVKKMNIHKIINLKDSI